MKWLTFVSSNSAMQEFFFTILVIWVLWKIFGGTASFRTYSYNSQQQKQEQENSRIRQEQQQSDATSARKKIRDDAGDYVDFEEIKD